MLLDNIKSFHMISLRDVVGHLSTDIFYGRVAAHRNESILLQGK